MKNLWVKILNWWESLANSDRRILTLAAPIVLLLVCYLLIFKPIISHYQETGSYRQQLSTSLVWLYENAALVNRMSNQCSQERLIARGEDDLTTFVKNIGRRSGATANIQLLSSRTFDVNVTKVSGTRAIALLQSYVCNGFKISELAMKREAPNSVEIEFNVRLTATGYLEEIQN